MVDSYILIQTACISLFLGLIEISYLLFGKKQRDNKIFAKEIEKREGIHHITRFELLKRKFLNTNSYQNYYKWLDKQMNLSFDEKNTPEGIIRMQEIAVLSGLIVFLMMVWIVPPFITIIILLIFAAIVFYPIFYYQNIISTKNSQFDKSLPMFINQVILSIKCCVSLENAFGFALRGMDKTLVQREYAKMVAELKIYSDDIPKVFMNLNRRVHTEECERFCNIIVSGLKNGNKMSDILKSEYERISDNQIVALKKKADSKKNLGTAINILLIFVPVILLLIIPMLRIGEMA